MAVAPRQRLTRDERYETILAAARTVFAWHGYHRAGTAAPPISTVGSGRLPPL